MMIPKWKVLFMIFILSLGVLTSCNMNNQEDNEEINQDNIDPKDGVEEQSNTNDLDKEEEKGKNLEFDKNRGPD